MITRLAFDEAALGRPCYRLTEPILEEDLAALAAHAGEPGAAGIFADAKVAAFDIATARRLLQAGFKKICTQVDLVHDLAAVPDAGADATIADTLALDTATVAAHARNFKTSRFQQDPALPVTLADRLYEQWIANSTGGRRRVAAIGHDFITFADTGAVRTIDLVSVLQKRRGRAAAMLAALLADAKKTGKSAVLVRTEAENAGALAAYRRAGFAITDFVNVFHSHGAGSASDGQTQEAAATVEDRPANS